MKLKEEILILASKAIKTSAISAAGSTSHWGIYQPKEPKNIPRRL
ncbi:cyclic lactone autoinducer peptide [Sedimentibacter hydroxybenzoicus DSM 7310]|uniref:Cyclic lactone autoinducer peptide n=1 Tax=Sedimentibacter hydroxybenzoicus DSM 7310 TaxID=1123245 RepID=A0A974BM89_SEDHY|nr:cyclic lactone autoinducer peptide [Sedimentibacter hydroxybenzoicus]NYB75553.1 cyclic lactone autoinducer peptide [Sedimentibacter hydroxybenzoicus DSM 7310]